MKAPGIAVGLNAVILAVTRETPKILSLRPSPQELDTLPFGPLDPEGDRTLELTLRGWVRERTGLDLGYVEQLYTFGDRDRDPRARAGGPRVLSVAYLALARQAPPSGAETAVWRDVYQYLPWEDWRSGRPEIVEEVIGPRLKEWTEGSETTTLRSERGLRVEIAFGMAGSDWDGYRVLERYELLYEAGLVEESRRDRNHAGRTQATLDPKTPTLPGRPMAMDHRRIVATALARVRGKIRYRPVVFELLPSRFTLLRLQRLVEALAGVRLHKQNFRRLVERAGLVEGTGAYEEKTGGRPAEFFRFRREVLRERRTAGVGLPTRSVDPS
ncbi:MAG: hypothetical protein WEA09_00805 [Gemmatimonadota bacterium]